MRKSRAQRKVVNNVGDRDIEWSWVASQMPSGPGEALDFGNGGSNTSLIAAQAGFKVTTVDLEPIEWTYVHPRINVMQGDLMSLPIENASFDLVINCSTVEHVGLAGRYGVMDNIPEGDLDAMAVLRRLMKPHARMLMTVPVGLDLVAVPLHRIYGPKRLPRLLRGFSVEKEEYWTKGEDNRWYMRDKNTALAFEPVTDYRNVMNNSYGLGCFVLRPAPSPSDDARTA